VVGLLTLFSQLTCGGDQALSPPRVATDVAAGDTSTGPFEVLVGDWVFRRGAQQFEQAVDRLDRRVLVAAAQGTAELQPALQGGDPAQQKMMMYMLPAVFTVMMLFLPSGLGIYMLTNSVLGILQQQAVERIAPRTPVIEVRETDRAGDKTPKGTSDPKRKLSGSVPAKLKGGS